jgi:hypothetical protein
MSSFVDAAAASDTDAMWAHLSKGTRATISREQFEEAAPELAVDVAKVSEGEIFLEEDVGDDRTVVAIAGGPPPGAYAEVLRMEDDEWKVELRTLDMIYGVSATQPSTEIDFQVNAPSPESVSGRLWVDGAPVTVERRLTSGVATFVTRSPAPRSGQHTVVAFARAGQRLGAIAWRVKTA